MFQDIKSMAIVVDVVEKEAHTQSKCLGMFVEASNLQFGDRLHATFQGSLNCSGYSSLVCSLLLPLLLAIPQLTLSHR